VAHHPVKNVIEHSSGIHGGWASLLAILFYFVAAYLISRGAGKLAARIVRWHDKQTAAGADDTARIVGLKRRETFVSIIRAAISLLAFAAALVMSVAQLAGGFQQLSTLAGLSFLVLLVGFSFQRILIDLLAGAVMFFERWLAVGDTVVIEPNALQGVVEDVSLRRVKLRALNGEVIQVHNSQIAAVRVLPHGVKRLAVEFFVSDEDEGREMVKRALELLPVGPTFFITRPEIEGVDQVSPKLARIKVRCDVAPGREWLAEDYLGKLVQEDDDGEVLVHGPLVLAIDERATRSFARATGVARRDRRRRQREAAG
jgi:small-conductance mechanosensitive channel